MQLLYLFPSIHCPLWLSLMLSGSFVVLPKSIIQTFAKPDASCTNNNELPITYKNKFTLKQCHYNCNYIVIHQVAFAREKRRDPWVLETN